MTFYEIKRNVPTEFKLIIFLIILAGIITTLMVVKVEVEEEYIDEVNEEFIISNITQEVINETKTINISKTKSEPIGYKVIKDSVLRNKYENEKKYLSQKYDIIFDEEITFCVLGEYKLIENYRLVNVDDVEICFENETSKNIELKEIYVGIKDDFHFEFNITYSPTKNVTTYEISYETVPKIVNVTINDTIVKTDNVTKTRIKEISLMKWILG
ncbi:hypothetical protein KY334_04865 [Candidatus Woesearchaeota archaeon]|nr:hypothetical protein [Candidatus Woesearchaeota archaeon]